MHLEREGSSGFKKEDKIEPCIVKKKAENSYLYSTTDLATLKYRKDILLWE